MLVQRILIVDDEAFSREAIAESIKWEEFQMQVLCASNGKEALKILLEEKIDVMLTDIKMPEMSGLELLVEVRKLGIDIEVIILSSYNEFELVRQAMKLGTCDYLFKPTMLPEDIIESVQKAANNHKNKEKEKTTLLQTNDYSKMKERETFLFDLMNGRKMEDDVYERKMQEFKFSSNINRLFIIVFKIIKYKSSMLEIFENDSYLMKASIYNVINETMEQIPNKELICSNFNEYIAVVWNNETTDEKEFSNLVNEALQKPIDFLEKYYKIDFSVGVSNFTNKIRDIGRLYREASFESDKGDLDHIKVHYANNFSGSSSLMKEVSASLDYIKDKLVDKNLSLQMVADHIGVSKNYYSKAFKETTGVNFIDHITKLRVEKARSLYIHTDLKIYEIAEKVGYSDWHYLYSVYKKVLGHSMSREKRNNGEIKQKND